MTDSLVIVGGGEHARVVADALRTSPGTGWILGFVDPDPGAVIPGLRYLGPDVTLGAMDGVSLVLGVGTHDFANGRPEVVKRLGWPATQWATVIHVSAIVAEDAVIGAGTVVLASAVVGPGARLGEHNVINSGAIVDHDVAIGDHSIVGPGVAIGGGAKIGSRVQIGIGACVRDHVSIGDDARIAMGAVVVRSVRPQAGVRGVPAVEETES